MKFRGQGIELEINAKIEGGGYSDFIAWSDSNRFESRELPVEKGTGSALLGASGREKAFSQMPDPHFNTRFTALRRCGRNPFPN